MTRAILTCMHAYTSFGTEYYEVLLDFYLQQMKKFQDEYDMLYLIEDDNLIIDPAKIEGMKAKIVHVDASLRYYDAFKAVLPQVEEDLVLFLDDDQIIYKEGVVKEAFGLLSPYQSSADLDFRHEPDCDVVSITDTIGTMEVPLKTGNKLCPYFFATRKELLMKYLDIDWSGDNMPYTETFGLLTEAMLKDDCKALEMEDDKTDVTSWEPLETEKTLGYYHIRAGSTVAYLLATKYYGDIDTYWSYLKNQPHSELLRHCSWFRYMGGDPSEVLADMEKARVKP